MIENIDRTTIEDSSGIMIKPDTLELSQEELLLADIVQSGYEIIFNLEIILTDEDVETLYPKEITHPVGRKKLLGYLSGKAAKLIALRHENLRPEESIDLLHRIKGNKEQRTGLRTKYNSTEVTEEDIANKTSQYYRFIMVNNLHVFDSQELFFDFLARKNIIKIE